jgi:hypothetical protein
MSIKKWRNISIIILLFVLTIVGIVNYLVVKDTKDQIYRDVNAIPKNKVGLLLGTAKYMDKAKNIINQYYQNRIDAAVALYMAGKIDYVIVSGDNSTKYYNEPQLMKARFDSFQEVLAKTLPSVAHRFAELDITPDTYLFSWWVTGFSKVLPLDIACRIWDQYLIEDENLPARVALAILHTSAPRLVRCALWLR